MKKYKQNTEYAHIILLFIHLNKQAGSIQEDAWSLSFSGLYSTLFRLKLKTVVEIELKNLDEVT